MRANRIGWLSSSKKTIPAGFLFAKFNLDFSCLQMYGGCTGKYPSCLFCRDMESARFSLPGIQSDARVGMASKRGGCLLAQFEIALHLGHAWTSSSGGYRDQSLTGNLL